MNAPGHARILFLHHSTGEAIWKGGVPERLQAWNREHGTGYRIEEMAYPTAAGSHPRLRRMLPARVFNLLVRDHYPWANYPWDYWNLWVAHAGTSRDRSEPNLDDLAPRYDLIIFKHCFPVSEIQPDDGAPSAASPRKTLANYKLQYEALKARLRQFPHTRFLLWTPPALTPGATTPEAAERAQAFAHWVKTLWDEPGDNIYLWDFRELETDGRPTLPPARATSPTDSHPHPAFATQVAPFLVRRMVDVLEGRGDATPLDGKEAAHGTRP